MSMKKLLLCILSLASAITLSAAPKDAVIEDLKITFMDEVIKSESIYNPVGTDILATVTIGKQERCVMSATLKGTPAEGQVIGYTLYKNDDNRFIFGKQNIDGQCYMVIYRKFQGVEILQERVLLSRKDAKKPVYLRMTANDWAVRFYYSFEPLNRLENIGWTRLGVMEGWVVGKKKDGRITHNVGLYGGEASVKELGPFKAKALQQMDTTFVCQIEPTYRNNKAYSSQGLCIYDNYAVIIRDI